MSIIQRLGTDLRLWIVALFMFVSACAPAGPSLEHWSGDGWMDEGPVELLSLRGTRDADKVNATASLAGEDVEIELAIELFIEPPARFVQGRYRARLGGALKEGPVSADSISFLGGQNTAPSVGGTFVFELPEEGEKYRVRFPAVIMERP